MDERTPSVVTIEEAAAILETTVTRVLMMLRRNELHGMEVDGVWQVDKASLSVCQRPQATEIVRAHRCGGCGAGCGEK